MYRTILVASLAACAGDDEKTDTDTDTGDDTGTAPAYPATWEGVQQLFADNCDRCHPSTNDVDLVPFVLEDLAGDQFYIVPGSSADSYLWQMVSGGNLNQMPADGLLPIATVAPLRDWIDAGALLE